MDTIPEAPPNILSEITTRLVKAVRPERIYLFGSYAYGTPDSTSDLDILLVVPEGVGRRVDVARMARRLMRDLRYGFDVVVRYPAEFDERSVWPTTIEGVVKRNGRLLYG
jgi:predicted nucleotidyltransferase